MPLPTVNSNVEAVFMLDPTVAEEVCDSELNSRDKHASCVRDTFDHLQNMIREMAASANIDNRIVVITINTAPRSLALGVAAMLDQ